MALLQPAAPQTSSATPVAVEAQVTQVAITQPVATPAPAPAGGVMQGLASSGFEGLELSYGSFPIISLKLEGVFEDSDRKSYGKEFFAKLQSTRKKYVFRALTNGILKDNKTDLAFSYDKQTTAGGLSIEAKIAEWTSQGKVVETKDYVEVTAVLVAPGAPEDGEIRLLSIPPASQPRLSGHMALMFAAYGANIGNVVTRVAVGDKIMNSVQPFYPWNFSEAK